MSEVLSQNEIDELLNALTMGVSPDPAEEEQPTAKVKDYDFRSANKFPKEHIRTLDIVFENFSQMLANHLTGILRVFCEAEVVSVDEVSFMEFSNSLPSPVILCIMDCPPLNGSIMLEVTSIIGYVLVSRLFGGADDVVNADKAFTEIELSALRRVLRQWMPLFKDAWARVADLDPSIDRIETSSQFAQIISMNEKIALITINVKVGAVSDFINICIPFMSVEPIATQLNTKLWFSSSYNQVIRPETDKIRNHLVNVPISMKAVFNDTTASLGDVMRLQVGDVIQIDHGIKDPITVLVGHIPKFQCMIGTYNSRYALKVADIIHTEEADDE